MRKSTVFATSLIMLGIACMLLSFAWNSVVRTQWIWTPDAAREYSQAAAELHSLPDRHQLERQEHATGGQRTDTAGPEPGEQERQAILDRYNQAQQRLDRARRVRNLGAILLRASGVLVTIVGIAWLSVIRQRAGS